MSAPPERGKPAAFLGISAPAEKGTVPALLEISSVPSEEGSAPTLLEKGTAPAIFGNNIPEVAIART